ncbi:hypothetical protein SAMN05421837_102271 [Amycolatopsis pretoriensis]|uniref:Uncharacterized protein n=2 Tax=Amycolatopsis pretoriensis TaxID=218821 RepID=A0A1H5QCK8_9PSEU|nr:hypothetical protein SAMN05421837_102271 [Amycolatopsis pretoriensis]
MTTVDAVAARVREYALKAVVATSKARVRVAVVYAAVRAAPSRRFRPRDPR